MKTKKVYLPDGKEVELLAKYKDGDETKYVVKVAVDEDIYRNELIYENRVVPNVYEKCEETPTFLYKSKLEDEVKRLEKSIKELREQETKLRGKMKSLYNPQFAIGTPIYSTFFGDEVEELKITKIVFTEQKEMSYHEYFLDEEYHDSFEKIGNGYYLTREEAEKARQEYLKNEKEKKRKEIEENYKRAKEEYEKIMKKSKKENVEK